jgi:hypothetical protein
MFANVAKVFGTRSSTKIAVLLTLNSVKCALKLYTPITVLLILKGMYGVISMKKAKTGARNVI